MGKEILGSSNRITEQPYAGSLFKSQNGSTWTADQTQDLMMRLYKAYFDITNVGEAVLGQYELEDAEDWQVFRTMVETIDPGEATDIKFYYKATSKANALLTDIPENAIDDDWREYTPSSNVFLNREMNVGPDAGTFKLRYELTSTDNHVSPAIDIEPAAVICIDQCINAGDIQSTDIIFERNGTGYDPDNVPSTNNGGIIVTGMGSGVIAEAVVSDGLDDIHSRGELIGIRVINGGSGFYESATIEVSTDIGFCDTQISPAVNPVAPLLTVFGETNYSGGNAIARYVSRQVTLPEERVSSDNLSIRLRGYRPRGSDIEVYYKVINQADDTDFDKIKYVRMDLVNKNRYSENVDDIIEMEWRPVGDGVSYTNPEGIEFNSFVTFSIKICLFTTSKSRVPYAQDMRVIAGKI
jgi:hypothetical protein